MDSNVLYKVKKNIKCYAILVGKEACKWTFTVDYDEFYIIETYCGKIVLSGYFKDCLAEGNLETVIKYIRGSTIIDPYKSEILDYLIGVKKSCDKDKKIDAIFDRLDEIEEKINQIDDKFKIIIDIMDSAKSN